CSPLPGPRGNGPQGGRPKVASAFRETGDSVGRGSADWFLAPFKGLMFPRPDRGMGDLLVAFNDSAHGNQPSPLGYRHGATCAIPGPCGDDCNVAQVWQLLDAICNDNQPGLRGCSNQQMLGGARQVWSMLNQWQQCKDPHEDICAEIRMAQKLLDDNRKMAKDYQDLSNLIRNHQWPPRGTAGTMDDAYRWAW